MNLKIEPLRKILIDLFKHSTPSINLYTFSDGIKSPDDVEKILFLLDEYIGKHGNDLFDISVKTGVFFKKDLLIAQVITELNLLSANNFERFSALICKCLGYDEFFVTKESHDQGLDFIAFQKIKSFSFDRSNFIVGQAKHKKGQNRSVTVSEVRELAGSILLLKMREFSVNSVYSRFALKTFTPTAGVFITGHFFTKQAIYLCNSSDIIYLDIIDVASLFTKAIRARQFELLNSKGEFDKKRFLATLKGLKIEK